MSEITVYTARKIRTMNPSMPTATAVACRDGMIIETGSLESMAPWLNRHPHRIDRTFDKHVLMPGFIDPHLHPTLAAMLLPCHFITAMEWKLPDRTAPPVKGHEAYLARLSEIHQRLPDPDEPIVTWGYHKIWHGVVDRETLNRISTRRPLIVWQRSFHEIIANDAAINWMKLDRDALASHPQIDPATGRFYETGLSVAMSGMQPWLLDPARFTGGLRQVRQAIHHGGHTTIGDLAVPLADLEREWPRLLEVMDQPDTPFRTRMIARGVPRAGSVETVQHEVDRVLGLQARNTHRLQFGKAVKLFADGGFFAELMQLQPPGFIDGHEGEWLMAPETFEKYARGF